MLLHRRRSREFLLQCFRVGVQKGEVTDLRFLERHVDFFKDALHPIACILKQYFDCLEEVPLLIEYFCILVSLLKAWKVTEMRMPKICHCAVGMAHYFFLVWPTRKTCLPKHLHLSKVSTSTSPMQKLLTRLQMHSTDSNSRMACV